MGIARPVAPGENIVYKNDDVKPGQVLVKAGTALQAYSKYTKSSGGMLSAPTLYTEQEFDRDSQQDKTHVIKTVELYEQLGSIESQIRQCDEEYAELNQELDKLAEKYGVTADAIAYAWLLRYPARMQVVLGTTNPARVKSAAKAAEITLTRGEWYALYKAAGNKLP